MMNINEKLCDKCSVKMKFEKIDLDEEQESYIRLDSVVYGLPVDVLADEMNTHTYYKQILRHSLFLWQPCPATHRLCYD